MKIEPAVWFPVVTLLIGFGTKWIADFAQHRWNARREREARLEQRRDLLRQRAADFQRETLLALQDSSAKLVRATGKSHHQDVLAARAGGAWGRQQLVDNVSDEFFQAQVATSTLRVRVRDDQVRNLALAVSDHCIAATMSTDQRAAERTLLVMSDASIALNERIGELLRNLDDEES